MCWWNYHGFLNFYPRCFKRCSLLQIYWTYTNSRGRKRRSKPNKTVNNGVFSGKKCIKLISCLTRSHPPCCDWTGWIAPLFSTAHTHTHAPLSSSPLFFLTVSKNTFKPISGINFTYSKLIILWWIERRRRWWRKGEEEDNEKEQGNLNGVLRGS